MKITQKKASNQTLLSSLTPALFTIALKNLPKDLTKEQLMVNLWAFLEKQLKEEFETKAMKANKPRTYNFKIVDIQVVEKNKALTLSQAKSDQIQKKIDQFRKFVINYDTHGYLPHHSYINDLHHIALKVPNEKSCPFTSIHSEKTKALFKICALERLELKIQSYDFRIKEARESGQSSYPIAFVTFEKLEQKRLASQFFFASPLTKFMRFTMPFLYKKDQKKFSLLSLTKGLRANS